MPRPRSTGCTTARAERAARRLRGSLSTSELERQRHDRRRARSARAAPRPWRWRQSAAKVVVAKGKKVVTFDMKKDPPDDDTLAAHLLGPTGNLKAPTLRIGDTLLVGFSEEAYRETLAR